MKTSSLKIVALLTIVISSFSFRNPQATVEVYIINNCQKDVQVKIETEDSASTVTFSKGEKRTVSAKVGSIIEAGDSQVFTVGAGDTGAKVYLCI